MQQSQNAAPEIVVLTNILFGTIKTRLKYKSKEK